MSFNTRVLARTVVTIIVIGSISACVTPAARVPCDGRLEPINKPAKKAQAQNERPNSPTPKVSP
jgi:hypothetical protein